MKWLCVNISEQMVPRNTIGKRKHEQNMWPLRFSFLTHNQVLHRCGHEDFRFESCRTLLKPDALSAQSTENTLNMVIQTNDRGGSWLFRMKHILCKRQSIPQSE